MKNIGFSTGCLYRVIDDVLSKNAIDIISELQVNNIELLARDFEQVDKLLEIKNEWLRSFSYISIHAPVNGLYGNYNESRYVLDKISEASKKFNAKLIIFHPDTIEDVRVFEDYSTLFLAIENMDDMKLIGKKPNKLKVYINEYGFNFLLDLQHIYVNDYSMDLCDKFLDLYFDELIEIHVSGFSKEKIHDLLYKTEQDIIIKKLKEVISKKDIPIIIESVVDNIKDLKLELEYIRNILYN